MNPNTIIAWIHAANALAGAVATGGNANIVTAMRLSASFSDKLDGDEIAALDFITSDDAIEAFVTERIQIWEAMDSKTREAYIAKFHAESERLYSDPSKN